MGLTGAIVGDRVGLGVGFPKGASLGLEVGLLVGDRVGLDVGFMVGDLVGLEVGLFVGDCVGLDVGFLVGDLVGLKVGLCNRVKDASGGLLGLLVAFELGAVRLQSQSQPHNL